MRNLLSRVIHDGKAATAAEFALVLPLLLIFLLGILDVGRLLWTWNRAEKATQMGVRYAVVTDMVPNGLVSYSFATQGLIPQGDPIPSSAFGGVRCTSNGTTTSCICNTGSCGPSTLISTQTSANAAFRRIVDRMRLFLPETTYSMVQVDYDHSGLGYAGDPNGPDVSPLVRVSIRPNTVSFTPLFLFNQATFYLPSFSAALTLEDGQGNVSN